MIDTPLSTPNQRLLEALTLAAGVIQQLDAQQVSVLGIEIRAGQPVLLIKSPPRFVRGVCRLRAPAGRYRRKIFAAPFHGVTLEWSVYERRVAAAGSAS